VARYDLREFARFEEREGTSWIPMRSSHNGLALDLDDAMGRARAYSGVGCVIGLRADNGRAVRCMACDLTAWPALAVQA
jgi:hypothetical protein